MDTSTPLLNNEQMLDVLSFTNEAVALHVSETAVIQYANDAMIAIWGKDKSVIGKSLEDALPELKGQPFIDMFRRVWTEGITFKGADTAAHLEVNGTLQTFYFNFEYRPIKDAEGKTYCILHMATDVTEKVQAQEREQNLIEELRAANEELSAANEEITAANEEINASNEELLESQHRLVKLYEDLTDRDARFRSIVKQAPVGICIIRARDLFIQDVNDSYLELVGRKREQMENKTIWEAIPEAAAIYAPLMNGVIETGRPFIANEHELLLTRNGVDETVFVDFVYEPIIYGGKVDAIMVLCINVTDKALAHKHTEEMEERIRLAVDAAETGTFDLDLVKGIMLTSDRFNTIFGFDRQASWKAFASAIHPDDQAARDTAHKEAFKNGKLFYEARVTHADDSIHWIRVQGTVYFDQQQKPVRILGTLLDITQFKRLEQQKDDFISIASHELKTPITSLKASLQMLEKMKANPASPMLPRLIEQSTRSMQKISTLVDDLLNVSRSNEGLLRLKKTTFTIAEMLEACCSHIRVAGKYTLTLQGDKSLQINADEHSIDQVVVNLVNNAVKYAPDSLEIFLIIEQEDNMAKISVKDNGPGIPAEKQAHLFDRYYQGDAIGYKNSGLGLGLYISSEIIKRHGGQIGVNSEEGKGSTFWFTLPL
jgi:PAS domain S-box-containing protein